jgi:hypothetical protein
MEASLRSPSPPSSFVPQALWVKIQVSTLVGAGVSDVIIASPLGASPLEVWCFVCSFWLVSLCIYFVG